MPVAWYGRLGRTGGRRDRRSGTPLPPQAPGAPVPLRPPDRRSAGPPSLLHRELGLSLGHHTEHHTVSTGQIRLRGAPDRRRRHPAIAVEVLLEVVGSPDEVVVIVQLIGLAPEAAHALHPRQELRLEGVLGPLHPPRRRTLVGELLQLFVD